MEGYLYVGSSVINSMRVGLGKQSQHRFQPLFRDEIVEGTGQIGTIATQLIVVGALCRGWRSESVEIK
jgi:hypothetical protein